MELKKIDEMEGMTKQKFVKMLESHDWFYQWSDDHSKWSRGCRQREQIMEAKKALGEDGEYLFEKYRKQKMR